MAFVFCTECGNQVQDSAKFCPRCGTKLTKDVVEPQPVAPAPAPAPVAQTAPVVSEPVVQPQPVAPQPAPAPVVPEPVVVAPQPVSPAPVVQPQPVAPQPAPVVQPSPAAVVPEPVVVAPQPVSPAPVVQPQPVAPQPDPARTLSPECPNALPFAITMAALGSPFGVPALIYAINVKRLYNEGDYLKAVNFAEISKKWATWGIVERAVLVPLYMLLVFAAMFA